jgi:hypothetical protein
MSDILVSIIESIADAAATAKARRAEAAAPAAPRYLVRRFTAAQQQAPAASVPAAPPPAPPIAAELRPVPVAAVPPSQERVSVRKLFASPDSLIRTVVAAEILGPPIALRRQNLWDSPSV